MENQQARLQLLFGTPLWRAKWPASLSPSLRRIADQVESDVANGEINSSFNKSNFLGFQSRRCLLKDSPYLEACERQALLAILKSILPLSSNFRILSWINCTPPGSHNSAHVHPGAEISGVFYISVPPESGRLVFRDPRPQSEMSHLTTKFGTALGALRPRFEVTPEPGELLLFPSWLMHQVEPGLGQHGLRISMAFNINGLKRVD